MNIAFILFLLQILKDPAHMKHAAKSAKLFYNDVYKVALPETHRFPMEKYRLTREGLQTFFANDNRVSFQVSPMATPQELQTTHCRSYIERYLTGNLTPLEVRRVGFPWSISGVQRSTSSVGGTRCLTVVFSSCIANRTVSCVHTHISHRSFT